MELTLRQFILLLISLLFFSAANAQTGGTLKARIVDAGSKQAVDFANASVVKAADSVTVKTVQSDKDGKISFSGLANGNYKLVVRQLGLATHVIPFSISSSKRSVDLGTIEMQPEVKVLNDVLVKGEKAAVSIKGDTVEFNAGSYKTQPNDNVEALLKKLPGVDVDKDGKVTAQGQQVNKILVDGKEFFGNDPKAVTKNLPADAIDKVQLIDDKTERAKNTGIDDGQREKVMNVTLKADKKSGWFGNAAAAGGNTERFLGQFNINHFDKKKQMSALFLSNNVNESGFTMEDLSNFSGGNIFDTFSSNGNISINVNSSGRANINGAFSGVTGGLITNHSGGLNYSDVWGKKEQLKFNANFVAVMSSNNLVQTEDIQNPAQRLFTNQTNTGTNTYNSYRLNLNFDYKVDSLTNIKFKPQISLGYKSGISNVNLSTADDNNVLKNQGNQFLEQSSRTPTFGGQFSANRKLPNGKGSFNFFANGSYTPYNNSYSNRLLLSTFPNSVRRDSLSNLYTSQTDDASNFTTTLSHIRQLSKRRKLNLTVSQNFQYRYDNANQATLDYNAVTGNYDILSPLYSGSYNNTNWRYSSLLGINKAKEKTTLTVNAEIANLGINGQFNGNNTGPVVRNEWAFVPNASFSYRPKQGSSFYLNVRSDVTMPSISDLQPFLNTSNTTYKRIGNPDLSMSRTLNFSANFNTFDMKSNRYLNFYGSYTQSWDGFSTESYFDNTGVTTSRPINTDGNFTSSFGFNLGQPSKIKGLRFYAGINGNVNRNVNFINNNKNSVLRISPGVSLGSNYDGDVWQAGIRTYTSYNNSKNSFQSVADRDYYNFNNTYSAGVKPVKSLRIFADLSQSLYRGTPASANTSVYLLNAGIERYFLKKQNLTLAINGFDLLNQNAGLQRALSSTGQITNTQTNILGQYFYMKLTYKITKLGSSTNDGMPGGIRIMR